MILAVTGGRDYGARTEIFAWLNVIHYMRAPVALLVHGACRTGLDAIAAQWAEWHDVPHTGQKHAAQWAKYGSKAGPIRNRQMLRTENVELLLAFPGGRGTADCIRAATELGIPVDDRPRQITLPTR